MSAARVPCHDCHGQPGYVPGTMCMTCEGEGFVDAESTLATPAAQWLREQFEFEWCAECGRDHRHHTAIPILGNWFARCDREPVLQIIDGREQLVPNPEGYSDTPAAPIHVDDGTGEPLCGAESLRLECPETPADCRECEARRDSGFTPPHEETR